MSLTGQARGRIRKLRHDGMKGTLRLAARKAYHRSGASELDFPLLLSDVADSTTVGRRPNGPVRPLSTPLTIGWVCAAPSLGSGGHTTMFRMVRALEQAGHTCQILLYSRHHGDLDRHTEIIRRGWPQVQADVRIVDDEVTDLDGCVATSWFTAHVMAKRLTAGVRGFYFIQDFEPFFYPRGSMYELAADSYRFGFRHIALGDMVASCISTEVGIESTVLPFGCDTDIYSLLNHGPRRGVVFYAKPGVPRRGYELCVLALREFHRRRPEQPIHVYGSRGPDLEIPVIMHDRLSPAELNLLYNGTIAGLAMSFTNISLVAEEMLAAGTIPVVNDSPLPRADIANQHVAWTIPTPAAIAETLVGLVDGSDLAERAAAAAQGVRHGGWNRTGQLLVAAVENEFYETVPHIDGDIHGRPVIAASAGAP